MNICLVSPPSPFLLDDRVFPNLGILQVAAALEEAGHSVYVEDLGGVEDYEAQMRITAQHGWDLYGVTATTPQFPAAIAVLRAIQSTDPGRRVVIGGPHATVMPDSCQLFDVVVMGDGETGILDALRPDAPRIIDYASRTEKGLLRYHIPSRHLINMDSYKFSIDGVNGTSILTEAGCSFNCSFCCGRSIPFYRRVRYRVVDEIRRELEDLQTRYAVNAAMDFSDEVNLVDGKLLSLCAAIKPLGMKLRAFVKANLFTDRQAEAMAEAGFVEICTGVESGSDRILGIIDKKTSREINRRFVELAHKHGMRAKAFMSLGQAGETYESAMESRDWLLWAKPDDFDVTVITVYPATPYWDERERIGVTSDSRPLCRYVRKSRRPEENGATLFFEEVDYASEWAWYKGKPGAYVSHVWTPDLSKEDLVRLRDQIEEDVRRALGIPYPKRFSGDHLAGQENLEHSMGAGISPQDSRVALKA